jgi:flagellar biosynthesis/type III secretory pathway M-ring protein FliF/YscJ
MSTNPYESPRPTEKSPDKPQWTRRRINNTVIAGLFLVVAVVFVLWVVATAIALFTTNGPNEFRLSRNQNGGPPRTCHTWRTAA